MSSVMKCPMSFDCLYRLWLCKQGEVIGAITIDPLPAGHQGGELDLFIAPKWRKKWLTKELREQILTAILTSAKMYNLKRIYSTALTPVSPRLLEFFGFTEYYLKQPKTFYYLEVA